MSKLRLITVFLFAVFMVLGVTAQVHTQKGIVRKVTEFGFRSFHSGAGCTSYCVGGS